MGKYISIIVLLACTLKTNAIDYEFMLKLGVTNTNERFEEETNNDNSKLLTGFDAGAIFGFYPIEKFGIQVEPGIISKGSEHDNLFGYDNNTYRLFYASMPVLINYKAYKKLHIFAGPEFNRKVDAIVYLDNSKIDGNKYYNYKNETGIQAGISYTLLKSWYFAVKYSRGLTPSSDLKADETGIPQESSNYYNQGVIVNVGWKIF